MSLKWCKYRSSHVNDLDCEACENKKKCASLAKSAETINRKNESDPNKIKHFGVWFDKDSHNLQINRDYYAIVDKKNHNWSKNTASWYDYRPELIKEIYDDDECRFYTDAWCERHKEKCLMNFDKNMDFFNKINRSVFNAMLTSLLNYSEQIIQIDDLSQCDRMSGIYIMALDKYKQVYIGQAIDIKKRILQHWRAKKQFDRLLWGGVDKSVISIDSFGALDTTRLFVLPSAQLNKIEKALVNAIPDVFKLNRIGGGGISDLISIISTSNERDFDSNVFIDAIEKAKPIPKERYQESVEYIRFSKSNEISIDDIKNGDVICIRGPGYTRSDFVEYFGKVVSITKNYINIIQYGKPGEKEWLRTVIHKFETEHYYSHRQMIKPIKKVWSTTSEVIIKNRTRYRKVKDDKN